MNRHIFADQMQAALSAYSSGDFVAAEKLCRAITKRNSTYFGAFHLLGAAQSALGKGTAALASYDRALALCRDDVNILTDRGLALQGLGRFDEALASYDRALAIQPDSITALNNRGSTLQQLERYDEALACFDRVLTLDRSFADAHFNRSVLLERSERYEEAVASLDHVLRLMPDDVEALNNKGNILLKLKRPDEALAAFDGAISKTSFLPRSWSNRGIALKMLHRFDEALASFDHALGIDPDYVFALNNRGNTFQEMHRYSEAVADYDRAVALQPVYVDAHVNRGTCLVALGSIEDALASFERALSIQPDYGLALSDAADCAAKLCDFQRYQKYQRELCDVARSRKACVSPFVMLNYSDDEALHAVVARDYWTRNFRIARALSPPAARSNEKIRIAYLSPDFRQHPVAQAIVGLFESHDRERFEVLGVSFGPSEPDDMRDRVIASLDGFYDVNQKSDQETAALLRELDVDIVIRLGGYTCHSRPGIFSERTAPIQVNYLGYAATTGADGMDYIIADAVALPFENHVHYAEKIVHLPGCYLANTEPAIDAKPPSRTEAGLPEEGFVYCCFNNGWKITPKIFETWMSILQGCQGSVLWLPAMNDTATRNLLGAAEAAGIDPARLIFAPRLPRLEDHLARHQLADLFLDTLPYNAHSTAADALWAGLPVLTCKGGAFVGRVASSLLAAIGLDEMIAADLGDYKNLALRLARDPTMLADIKSKLVRNRETHPLFDRQRFARNIESAYATMWNIRTRGEPPRSFAVERIAG
jgi:predicted O-linked N-acetylglucosamine transferase (SPINDLY family)